MNNNYILWVFLSHSNKDYEKVRQISNTHVESLEFYYVYDELWHGVGIPLPYPTHTLGCFYPYSKHTQTVWVGYGYSIGRAREVRRKCFGFTLHASRFRANNSLQSQSDNRIREKTV